MNPTRKRKVITNLIIGAVLTVLVVVCLSTIRGAATHECHDCGGTGLIDEVTCEACGGTGTVEAESMYSETFVALLPPIVAIALALISKEVYSSLFVGVVMGGVLYSNFSFAGSVDAVISNGVIAAVADSAGIFIFLVILGIIVALVNKAGGSQAFGRWAQTHIHTKVGASLATFALGVLIFIDDYFNCLTVGSVMRPVTDSHKTSRVKLAYLIDATAAPVCMIAPISSWAAAVSSYTDGTGFSGLELFVRAIPYNFYSLLTLVFIVAITLMKFDYGTMAKFESKAQSGDLCAQTAITGGDEGGNPRGRVIDLLLPILLLVVTCVIGLIYVGGFFGGASFVAAFGDTDAFVGLPWGGLISLVVIIVYLVARRVISLKDAMECVPKGFIAMVPAILILSLATALKNMTSMMGAKYFVSNLMAGYTNLGWLLPALIFVVACFLAFSTGTSWGTFGILIPIVTGIFDPVSQPELFIIGISACLAGAVCGDHCSPISDTTIMASAGAQCNHVDHVATQLPYALTVAAVSFVSFLVAGLTQKIWIALPVAVALMIGTLFVIRYLTGKKAK